MSNFDNSDIAPLLVPPPTSAVKFGQGTIISWNPETFANQVNWRGIPLRNLPVLAGTDALTFREGDTVGLLGWDAGGQSGAGSWWIIGRLIAPGAGAGAQVIDFMRTELVESLVDDIVANLLTSPAGQELAAFVLSQRVHVASAEPQVVTTSNTYQTLAGGPSISGVPISASGTAVVFSSATIQAWYDNIPSTTLRGGYMSFAVSGATSVAAVDANSVTNRNSVSVAMTATQVIIQTTPRASSVAVITGLNEGNHTFTAQYRKEPINDDASFSNRSLAVIAL